jgi:hypothetical protein
MGDDLAIYLNDHLMGATAGCELARRIAGRSDAVAEPVGRIAEEVEEDRRRLEELMRRLEVRPDRLKVALGRVAERAGRAKPNGHLLSRSPLSRMEELEVLALGIEAKASLWRALRATRGADPRIDVAELDGLVERAASQRERVEELWLRAAREALGG